MTSPARVLAFEALRRIESQGAYANIVVPAMLEASELTPADRRLATELVYGTTRRRRACDALTDRFVVTEPDAATRTVLRLGAYQLAFTSVPAHAAVGECVDLAPRRTRGFVNAVLRKVASTDAAWPSEASRLSYPDWIVERLIDELGRDEAVAALERMNTAPGVTERPDGYAQDPASTWVADAVEATAGERVLDVCAAPGGKATAMAASGATVVAADRRPSRVSLVVSNAVGRGSIHPVVADGTQPTFRPGSFDAVLVDAPCSGLGALRRRPDARWRIREADVVELAVLQARLLEASATMVRPGGRLVYSVCTLTAAESVDHPVPADFDVDSGRPVGRWVPYRHGWRVLPHHADTDGMVMIRYRRRS